MTITWNKLVWNDLTMARIDRILSKQSNESVKYRSVINFLPNTAKYASLGVDHLIFDGGVVQIPQKISSICFWLKKKFLQNS